MELGAEREIGLAGPLAEAARDAAEGDFVVGGIAEAEVLDGGAAEVVGELVVAAEVIGFDAVKLEAPCVAAEGEGVAAHRFLGSEAVTEAVLGAVDGEQAVGAEFFDLIAEADTGADGVGWADE